MEPEEIASNAHTHEPPCSQARQAESMAQAESMNEASQVGRTLSGSIDKASLIGSAISNTATDSLQCTYLVKVLSRLSFQTLRTSLLCVLRSYARVSCATRVCFCGCECIPIAPVDNGLPSFI